MADDCVFCGIAAGERPASVVYEDDTAIAFMTRGPVTEGHTLVIPKAHYAFWSDVPEAVTAHLYVIAQRVAEAIRRSGLRCEGINIFLADGAAAFQEVFHYHVHVFPRYVGDPFKLDADWSIHPERAELDAVADRIRSAYLEQP